MRTSVSAGPQPFNYVFGVGFEILPILVVPRQERDIDQLPPPEC